MDEYTNVIYIDESGVGAPTDDLQKYWVSSAVTVPFEEISTMDQGVSSLLDSHLHPRCTELKGSELPSQLQRSSTIDDFADDFSNLLSGLTHNIWVASSYHGVNTPAGVPAGSPVKRTVRHLLFERVNGYLNQFYSKDGKWLIVWDLSHQQELEDFSSNLQGFRNAIQGDDLNSQLNPSVLGGLSHDWTGLQLADIVAHLGLHYRAVKHGVQDGKQEKADAFRDHVWPHLQSSARGKTDGIGWKEW